MVCMCVVSHGYGGLGGVRDEGGEWYACRTKPSGLVAYLEFAGVLPECQAKTLMTPDHTVVQVRSSGRGLAGIGLSSLNGFSRDATRWLRFVVHAAGWRHSMVLHGCSCCC